MTTLPLVSLDQFMARRNGSVNPAQCPDETFDLYSIPAYDRGEPDIVVGSDVGSSKQPVQTGDVLLSKIVPHIRRAWVVGPDRGRRRIASSEWIVFRSELVHPEYLRYALVCDEFHHKFMSTVAGVGGSLLRARPSHVATLQIPLPYPDDPKRSLAEQKRIAAILDKADAIRRRRQEAAHLTDQLIPAIFYEMFSKWLRMPQAEMAQLGDEALADIVSGVTKGRRFGDQETVIVPYIRVANVQDGYLDLSEIKEIEVLPQDVEALRLQHGDVLMTEGGDFDKLGRGGIWEQDVPDCIHQNHVFRVRCNRSKLQPLFFANYIRTHLAKAYFLRCAKKTSNLATINKTQLRALPVPRVPMDAQKRFVAQVEDVRSMQQRYDTTARETDDLFNSLVQRAFGGEL